MSALTEKAIKEAFLKLLEERPLGKITVGDIARECGINRNSFYYHYRDIPALMEEIALDRANSLIEAYPDIDSLEQCVEVAFRFILENRKSISHIYHSLDREIFEKYLMKICAYTIQTWADSAFAGLDLEEDRREKLLRLIRFELFGACIDWMNEGMKPEAMEDVKEMLTLTREGLHRMTEYW